LSRETRIDTKTVLYTFAEESYEALSRMEDLLLYMEASSVSAESCGELLRIVHTLKGNALTVGLGRFVEMAHAVEDLLDSVCCGRLTAGGTVIDVLFAALDAFRATLYGRHEGNGAILVRRIKILAAASTGFNGALASSAPWRQDDLPHPEASLALAHSNSRHVPGAKGLEERSR
jgi:two-component system chemotaxis sensor kinase CheA